MVFGLLLQKVIYLVIIKMMVTIIINQWIKKKIGRVAELIGYNQ